MLARGVTAGQSRHVRAPQTGGGVQPSAKRMASMPARLRGCHVEAASAESLPTTSRTALACGMTNSLEISRSTENLAHAPSQTKGYDSRLLRKLFFLNQASQPATAPLSWHRTFFLTQPRSWPQPLPLASRRPNGRSRGFQTPHELAGWLSRSHSE